MVWSNSSFISLKTQFLSVWIFLVLSICFIPKLFPFRAKYGCQAVSVISHLVQSSETQRHRDMKCERLTDRHRETPIRPVPSMEWKSLH